MLIQIMEVNTDYYAIFLLQTLIHVLSLAEGEISLFLRKFL